MTIEITVKNNNSSEKAIIRVSTFYSTEVDGKNVITPAGVGHELSGGQEVKIVLYKGLNVSITELQNG